jgi:hypothetical protein
MSHAPFALQHRDPQICEFVAQHLKSSMTNYDQRQHVVTSIRTEFAKHRTQPSADADMDSGCRIGLAKAFPVDA